MFLSKIVSASLVLFSLFGSAAAYTNPIRNPGGGDPQISWFDGYYYFISTEWTNLQLARATTIEGLKTATPKVIYSDSNPTRCCSVWAPEIHYFDGRWYLYYTAGNDGNLDGQRMHVLQGGASPWDDWSYAGRVTDDWSLDGTVVRFNDWGNYFVYSCMTGVPNQSTCVRKLNDDYISASPNITIISQPDQPWEQSEVPVQEGQYGLYFGGKTYIAYSANYCWTPDYCVALLEWDGVTDPSSPSAWTKSDGCKLTAANGNFGTGHNSFFRSPDETETYITFHATGNANGACDDNRYVMVQPITANADGTPNFGVPQGFDFQWAEPSA
ncbi:glycosyl family 43 [Colletotrichum incanum]|uniref:Glycosyl family 43 n=1 Tax=Colletotrichum incanum TaxID=1573173 RepID=A0A166LBX4_COLIC|nr:glycosyl family 43 [Colletotrichum incanum]